MKRFTSFVSTVILCIFCLNSSFGQPANSPVASQITSGQSLEVFFDLAYQQNPTIPKGMLEAVAWHNTRFHHLNAKNTDPSCTGMPQYQGVMGLIADGKGYFNNNLALISSLSGVSVHDIITSPEKNILAYAKAFAILQLNLNLQQAPVEDQLKVLEALSEIPASLNTQSNYALNSQTFEIYRFLDKSENQTRFQFPSYNIPFKQMYGKANFEILNATHITIDQDDIRNEKGERYQYQFKAPAPDYGPAIWNPAASCNYSSRSGTAVQAVTVHTVQGSYAGAISWFKNCAASVSAHYVLRSSDGQVTQMVLEADKGWHVGIHNPYTIGLEHEGFVEAPSTWYTTAMYNSSADLVRDILNSGYGIAPLRTFHNPPGLAWNTTFGLCTAIKGHVNYSSQTHTDPGSGWDWERYYQLINPAPSPTVLTATSGNFYDSGGPAQNYPDDQRQLTLINPPGATSVSLTFTSFNLENSWDNLYIYDGTTITDPLIGIYSGTNSPGTINSSGGELLIEFRSDCATVDAGWEAWWISNVADIIPPTTVLAANGVWQTNDFNVVFSDIDNPGGSGIQESFYQVLGWNGSEWRANGNSGFFNDNFDNSIHTDWNVYSGQWGISTSSLNQNDINDGNSNIYIPINQQSGQTFLYEWMAMMDGNSTNRRSGLHFFCDNANLENRGNSYFVYYRVDHDRCQIYKVENDVWTLKTDDPVSINQGIWNNYKIMFNQATGQIKAFFDNTLVSEWTDPTPHVSGQFISPRTGNADVLYNDLKVYKSRSQSEWVSVGTASTDEIQVESSSPSNEAAIVKSIVVDNANNWSTRENLGLFIDWTPPSDPVVQDGSGADIDIQNDLFSLSANWSSSSDPNSAIANYWYAIGTTSGATDIVGWTNNGLGLTMTETINLVDGQQYFVSVKSENGAGLFSNPISSDGVLVQDDGCGSIGLNTSVEWIEQVCANNACLTSGSNGGYGDYTHLRPKMFMGNTYNLTLTPGFSSGSQNEFWRVWMDFNFDGDFDDTGEKLMQGQGYGQVTGSFTIPANQSEGLTILRFSMQRNGFPTPCDNVDNGEVEDYGIRLLTLCPKPVSIVTTNISTNSATINWNAHGNTQNINIRIRAQGSSNWNVLGVSGNSFTLPSVLQPNTTYEYQLKAVCSAYSESKYSASIFFVTLPESSFQKAAQPHPEEALKTGPILFPNPAKDRFYISQEIQGITMLRMTNIKSQFVVSVEHPQQEIDVTGLPSGIYQVEIVTTDGTIEEKLVID